MKAYVIGLNLNTSNSIYGDLRITKYKSFECLNSTHIIDWDRQICSMDNAGENGLCNFEYGSPLMVIGNLNGKEKLILVGVLSKKSSCDGTKPVG